MVFMKTDPASTPTQRPAPAEPNMHSCRAVAGGSDRGATASPAALPTRLLCARAAGGRRERA